MAKAINWDQILLRLPERTRRQIDKGVRAGLVRYGKHARPSEADIPDYVRNLAVGAWRDQYLAGASKGARRRMGYSRLKDDPSFLKIQMRIMREHGLLSSGPSVYDPACVAELAFSEACEAYRATNPRYGSSPLDSVIQETIRQACQSSVDSEEMLHDIVERVRAVARTGDLASCTHRPFDLTSVTSQWEVSERVRATRLVHAILVAEYGRQAKASLAASLASNSLRTHPYVQAIRALARRLYGADPVEALVTRAARRQTRKVDDYLEGEELEWLVAADVMANPHYAPQIRYAIELRDRVRENVPETPMDAYPLARTLRRHFVLHVGPTNSGKTHDAIAVLAKAASGAYLGPLRLLAYEQFDAINRAGCPCSLLTGEEACEVAGAKHVSSTIEMANYYKPVDVAVIDEAQMISDHARGHHWTAAILGMPAREIHVCCAPHAQRIVEQLVGLCDDTVRVQRHERLVPLVPDKGTCHLPDDVCPGDALIVFSRRAVHAVAAEVARRGFSPSMIYGALPHDVRHEEARRFDAGETDVVVATDAIGMGMNLPIRRIVFVEQEKFDGRTTRPLSAEEVQQIAGRAGRYGRYERGLYQSTRMRKDIIRRYVQTVPAIESIPVGIPNDIALVQDATLSDAVRQWMELEQPEPFRRIDVARDMRLIREVEEKIDEGQRTNTDIKLLILALASMAFDERDARLMATWRRMVDAELAAEELVLAVPDPPQKDEELARLEADYKYCDLLYTYARTFDHTTQVSALVERRSQISRIIMAILGS